jgi:hypothetical protein
MVMNMTNPISYETDIIKYKEILSGNKNNEYLHSIFRPHVKDFELEKKPSADDIETFKKDWPRSHGIKITKGNKTYHILPSDIDLGQAEDPVKALHDFFLEKYKDSSPTNEQVERIVQHYSQKSIQAIGHVLSITNKTILAVSKGVNILELDITDLDHMKMNYSNSNFLMLTDENGRPKFNQDDNPIYEFYNDSLFKTEIDQAGNFKECKVISQYQKAEDSPIEPLREHPLLKDCFKKVQEDITDYRSNLIIDSLHEGILDSERILGLTVKGFCSEFENKNTAIKILEATIFDPEFPKVKKQDMLDEVLKRENGKELLEGALVNRVVGYLNEEFKKHEGTKLKQSDKNLIAKGLGEIISPLKGKGLKDIEGESLKLVDDLNIDKLVSSTARESEDLKHGFIGKIKKFCRRVLDSIFTSKDKDIFMAFKSNVKEGSVENPTKMRSGKGLQI